MEMINKIRARLNKIDAKNDARTGATDLSADHQLNFNRDANEQWSFKDGHIYLNNEDIEDLLDQGREDVSFQSAVSDAISEYKDFVWKKGSSQYQKFAARADGIQGKILGNMKRIYDERTGGVRLAWGDGAYLLNNVNVRAIVALYHVRPTEKARRFLRGLKSKLALILINKNGSSHFDRINSVVKSLYDEVEDALDRTPIDACYLPVNSDRHTG